MSFQLEANESLGKSVKHIVRKQIESALSFLQARVLRDEAVHEARKHFKRIRAVIRLVRGELGEQIYHRENLCFRDAARPLTEIRDARVLLETFDKLRELMPAKSRALPTIRRSLEKHHREIRRRVLNREHAVATVKTSIKEAVERVEDWPIDNDNWPAIGSGLKSVYKKGSRAFDAATRDPSAETWHEWRKQSKYLWHQIQMLEPLWAEVLKKLGDEVHRLTQILGDDHDLTVLRHTLLGSIAAFGGKEALETPIALAEHRSDELRREAVPLGRRIYLDSPNDFADRFHGYWKAWRSEAKTDATDQ
jgi:CHAD domain-containing protein